MKPSQLAQTLEFYISNKFSALIVGQPGIGKTEIVKQTCEKVKADLIISHPVVSDPTDYKGLPFVIDADGDKTAEFLPFGELKRLIDAKKDTVFFLDDLGQAPSSVQAACMQLILGRRINGHVVSNKINFVAATNRRQDMAGVQGILEPVKSRFTTIVELTVDIDDWIKWAIKKELPSELIAFIRYRPNLLCDFKPSKDMINSPCPRTVANVGLQINRKIPKELEYECFAGAAGEGFASEFISFLRVFRNLPNIDMILMHPEKVKAPPADKPDILYATCGALASRITDANINNAMSYIKKMPAEFQVLCVKDMVTYDEELTHTKAFIEWASDNKDVVI